MKRAALLLALSVGLVWLIIHNSKVEGQTPPPAQWIWLNEGDPTKSAPAETIYFRRVFDHKNFTMIPVDEATLDITADNAFTVWFNGVKLGSGNDWSQVYSFDVKKHFVVGKNVIAVEAANEGESPAGLMVRLGYTPNGQSKVAMVSDGTWSASRKTTDGWQKVDYKEEGWTPAKALGAFGSTAPWNAVVQGKKGKAINPRFSVPEGFQVVKAVREPDDDKSFSLINMCFDDKGRLLVSREGGAIYLCTEPDKSGVLQKVNVYCDLVKNCQGMCWVKDALLLVGNGPKGTGLFRCTASKGDKCDKAEPLHLFQGGMGEHGPHAIIHGPDGWLYLVIGNHAWAKVDKLADNSPLTRWPKGSKGPDQSKAGTTEDVLLPRLNDSNGHAADILAPGGTIWRLDHQGKNMSLVAAGFRNHYDAAFSPSGELFTFDSDMEWDEALPWYRAVRVCHCPPGADYVWRTGAANTPDYYLDSLPPMAETGRGSPVGVEFYDHHAFPEKYRGAFFMADWSIGVIWAVKPERKGASYTGKPERFCTGAPMNVTDLAVGPDGALWFSMGGRGTQGGVYRIEYTGPKANTERFLDPATVTVLDLLLEQDQPLSPKSRAYNKQVLDGLRKEGNSPEQKLLQIAANAKRPIAERLRSLNVLHDSLDLRVAGPELKKLASDKDAEIRAQVIWMLGASGIGGMNKELVAGLKDKDALVRRRACEALVRANIKPAVNDIWPLLKDPDRFVRHAARLVLERIPASEWANKLWTDKDDTTFRQGVIALCQTNQAAPYAENLFARLRGSGTGITAAPAKGKPDNTQEKLDHLRTVEMALIHTTQRPAIVRELAVQCEKMFPATDWRVNRELAILLVEFQREKLLDQPIQPKLMKALLAAKEDRMQQIHYAYCMRLLKTGWTPALASSFALWYESTRDWRGGHSFTPFLENIFKDSLDGFGLEDRKAILTVGNKATLPAQALAKRLQTEPQQELLPELTALLAMLPPAEAKGKESTFRQAVEDALAKTALKAPTKESFPFVVKALESKNPLLRAEALSALRKLTDAKPKADEPAAFRALLQAVPSLNAKDRWQAVELLRQWTGRGFGAETGKADPELKLWARWFGQTFPKEPALPDSSGQAAQSKWEFKELLTYLDGDGKKGDATKGRAVFEKANCIKCHKYGKEGVGVGPDLSDLRKRFKRGDILEAILDPSKVISDQYRSVTITTLKGQQITGLAAVQGDVVTVLLQDTTQVPLKRTDIESQVASLISVMPERLLDTLTREEIADLFAFLESEPR